LRPLPEVIFRAAAFPPFSILVGNAMSDGITITPNTQAQKVREELFRITGQEGWNRDEYWKYYLVKPSSLWQAAV
jgi:hypothetical protein